MITIVEVSPMDVQKINHCARLLTEYFIHHADNDIEKVSLHDWKRLSDLVDNTVKSRHRMFLAYKDVDDAPVGIAGISRTGCAEHLYVTPEYRGNGIARSLVTRQFEEGAWFTTVNEYNQASLSLIRGMGFRELDRHYNSLVVFIHDDVVDELDESSVRWL